MIPDPSANPAEGLGQISGARRLRGRLGIGLLSLAALTSLAVLAWLLILMVGKGWTAIDWQFFTSFTSRFAAKAGIKAALVGTLWLGISSMLVALPLGILAAIYLNEFARAGPVTSFLRASIANLAGVPSVVFGILGLALFVRAMHLGSSIAAAGLTLGLLTLPIVIVVSEEALKSVPRSIREAAFGLGASRWQTVRHHVLPYSLPGMLTGSILALSRTMGETAPLIIIGAATAIFALPTGLTGDGGSYTALPIQSYYWAENAKEEFQTLAWGGVTVLVSLVLVGNLAAIVLRNRFQKRYRW
ncbi:MAG: phosphate ABC transporter permease PstA [Candidatus Thermoplasmatota archaeon]|jgi:phosphate transport system permease protein